jgi:hypothetical protein
MTRIEWYRKMVLIRPWPRRASRRALGVPARAPHLQLGLDHPPSGSVVPCPTSSRAPVPTRTHPQSRRLLPLRCQSLSETRLGGKLNPAEPKSQITSCPLPQALSTGSQVRRVRSEVCSVMSRILSCQVPSNPKTTLESQALSSSHGTFPRLRCAGSGRPFSPLRR